jgi:hypothetical protein
MTNDPAELPIKEYITKGAAEGALVAARRLTETIGVTLNEVLRAMQDLVPPTDPGSAALAGVGTMTARADVVVHGETGVITVSAPACGPASLWLSCWMYEVTQLGHPVPGILVPHGPAEQPVVRVITDAHQCPD